MLTKILVPLDGTRFAEAALPYAMYLAQRDGAALQLATVWPPMTSIIDTADWIKQLEIWEENRRAESRRYLSEVARRIQGVLGRTVSVKYLLGRPNKELARAAKRTKADLVVMATHGHGPVNRVWLGSVADHYVREGSVPVLLVRPHEELPEVELVPARPFRKILVPLDGSELAEQALRKSLLLGSGPKTTQITLLTVVGFPVPMATPEGGVVLGSEELLNALREAAAGHLTRMAKHLETWGCKVDTRVVAEPITWKAIVDFATSGGYDLIAMATHGRGGATRVMLGSVADKVLRSSSVPTLLIHPEQPKRKKEHSSLQEQLSEEALAHWP
jgi:nucleotide-binding universal stress UspA family protein